MNRLISQALNDVTRDRLPPAQKEGRTRVLFLHWPILGWKTQVAQIKNYAGRRDDIDAVHIDVSLLAWVKLLGKSLPLGGWDLHSYRYALMYRWMIGRWFRGPLDLSRFDVVHVMTQWIGWAAADQCVGKGVKLALQIDSTSALQCRDFGHSRLASTLFRRVERHIFNSADWINCWTNWSAQSVMETYGISADKVAVIPPSILAGDAIARAKHEGKVKLLFVGNDWERKGGPLLLSVQQNYFADSTELHVVSTREPKDLSPRGVIWHGAVPHEQLIAELIPSMDIVVIPSNEDTFVLANLEAQAAGLPVISTALAGIPEVVVDGATGILIQRGDRAALAEAIGRLVKSSELRTEMGLAGQARAAERFSAEKNYPLLMDRLVKLGSTT